MWPAGRDPDRHQDLEHGSSEHAEAETHQVLSILLIMLAALRKVLTS
jgi:hypothetical protein